MKINVFYTVLSAKQIFGMVGRCGGGYNTVWEDWSTAGRLARDKITQEYEEGLNAICGHYARLEASILSEGFRNPMIITCGNPIRRELKHLPPEIKQKPITEWLLLEGVTGGSRLWVAQKHNLQVPCIVNDTTGQFNQGISLVSADQAAKMFKDPPAKYSLTETTGFSEHYNNSQRAYHMDPSWSEERIVLQRAPLWVSIMNKHGYYVDRLQPFVLDILAQAGVVQPIELRQKVDGSIN